MHIGVEAGFRPARKAHPAFLVSSLAALRARLQSRGISGRDDDASPAIRRFYADDPWGNRLEFFEAG